MRQGHSIRWASIAASVLVITGAALADPAAPKTTTVTLEKRANNGPYGKSAYSFRTDSQDVKVHKNFVDVLFNGCGQIHVEMYNASKNRVCDLGAMKLADAPMVPPANATWFTDSFVPTADHVYFEEIDDGKQQMTVAFHLDAVNANAIELTWMPIKPLEGTIPPNNGANGTHGQCGGKHKAE